MKPIFTIESWDNGYYFDLLSNLKFGVSYHEKVIFTNSDPNECIKLLKSKNCICSENYCKALKTVLEKYPDIDRVKLEKELDKFI